MTTHVHGQSSALSTATQTIPCIALPEPNLSMEQDAEWCVIREEGGWREIRFHDYGELYTIPGLYERLFYDILKCNSPTMVRKLLEDQLRRVGQPAEGLRVLDVGAGNGMVGEELADLGAQLIVGIDILEEAAEAAKRDRPGVYADYQVLDLTDLASDQRQLLASYRFDCLTCVAALGFGDIPTLAFAEAYNVVADGGWIAFNIKEDFLDDQDPSGFSGLIRRLVAEGLLVLRTQRRYQHRIATNGDPLHYVAVVGTKAGAIPRAWVSA